jgi:signal transduction histidine kinase
METASMIIVEDDGTGFDSSQLNELHTTMNNIRQRLKMMCHGTLEIMPRDKGGTIVRVTIPD